MKEYLTFYFRFGAAMSIGALAGTCMIWYLSYAIYRCLVEPRIYREDTVGGVEQPGSRLPLVETSCSSPVFSSGKKSHTRKQLHFIPYKRL